MKILNGNRYFEKSDINEIRKQTIYFLSNPEDTHVFLYSFDKEERDTVISGIDALNNTISWEFSSESAVNLKKIEECYKTLSIIGTNKISYDEFKKIPVETLTSYSITKYENWLKSIGHDLFFEFFAEYSA
mgnify:FL=1|jgi:hypothetical protein